MTSTTAERRAAAALDTVAAALTPRAPGAIAVVRVTGPLAEEVIGRVFAPRGRSGLLLPVGEVRDPASGAVLDEAVLATLPPSPSGARVLDLAVHGGRGTVDAVLAALEAAGARVLDAEAFARFLVERGDHDALALDAILALGSVPTLAGAVVLAHAAAGRLSAAVEAIEAGLAAGTPGAREGLEKLAADAAAGIALVAPRAVALLGATNAGKSTLFNALAGGDRAITSPAPNTTRDALEEVVLLGGYPVRVVDTAGVGAEATDLDRRASEVALRRAAAADVVVRVVDGSRPCDALPPGSGPIAVTKSDLESAIGDADLARLAGGAEAVRVSGVTGAGLDRLAAAVVRALALPERPLRGPALFAARHARIARESLAARSGAEAAAILATLRRPAASERA